MLRYIYLRFFLAASIVHLGCLICGIEHLATFTKVLLMPSLAVYYVYIARKFMIRAVNLALFFSWLGDNFLISSGQNSLFFLAGLFSFLLAHLSNIYACYTADQTKRPITWDIISISLIGFAVLNLICLLGMLIPALKSELVVPVTAYAIALSSFLVTSLFLRNVLAEKWIWLPIGIILFIASDSLIAFRQFRPSVISFLPMVDFWVMLTYILAQWIIVNSFAKIRENTR